MSARPGPAPRHPELDAPGTEPHPRLFFDPTLLAIRWFLVSLTVLFATAIIGWVKVRWNVPADQRLRPDLPHTLWLSTALLVWVSVFLERGRRAIRADRRQQLVRALGWTFFLGVAFVTAQCAAWLRIVAHGQAAFAFFILTWLHALHVIGGLVLLAVVYDRARSGRYWSLSYPGVSYVCHYWHFLGASWLAVLLTLWFGI